MSKRLILVAVLAFAFLLPGIARAENTGYDKGFFIKNDDDTFMLKFKGRLQTKFYFQKAQNTPKQLSFSIRRAQLDVKANMFEKVSMGFTLKHAVSSAANDTFQTVNITGATATVEVIPEFAVTVGMVGLPLDFVNEVSSAWYLLPEPPITYTQDDGVLGFTVLSPSFGAPDGLGVNFSGGYWKWFYSLSVVNATESNYTVNPDMKMSFGFRTGINILDPVPGSLTDFECSNAPKLTLSLGTMYQNSRVDPNTGANVDYLWTSSLGGAFRWGGFSFTAEGYYRKSKYDSIGTAAWLRPTLTDIGYYAAAGYYIIPKMFEVAGQAGQIIRQGPDNNAWQFGGGFNYYPFENNLKLQLAYTFTDDYDGITGPDNLHVHNITLMASALF